MKIILFLLIVILTGCSDIHSSPNTNTNSLNTTKVPSTENIPSPSPATTPTQLSTFTTTIYTKTSERQNNVKIACDELNGTIVAVGETFSFTSTLGPANPSDGYQKADTFDNNGEIMQEYGGGKCQISSTLYNAVLAVPTLVVIERHEHSNEVPYVEEGKDAAVAYGSVDFKFRNDTGKTIRIDASCTDDNITISLFQI